MVAGGASVVSEWYCGVNGSVVLKDAVVTGGCGGEWCRDYEWYRGGERCRNGAWCHGSIETTSHRES